MKGIRNFIAMAIIASFVLPASAVAVMLDLSANNPIFTTNYASGSVFTNPAGLGWDLTVVSSTGGNLRTNSAGVGVDGGASAQIDAGEYIDFLFTPAAMLSSFTIASGNNDVVAYSVNGGSGGVGAELLSGSPATIAVVASAGQLRIASLGPAGFRVASVSFGQDVPEPTIIGLMGLGLFGMGAVKRIKKAA